MSNLFPRRHLGLRVVLLVSLLIAAASAAQDATPGSAAPEPADDGWKLSVTIPLWVSSQDTHLEARGVELDSSISFGDILADLQGGLLLATEARKDKLSLGASLIWLRIGDDESVQVGGGALPLPPVDAEVQIDTVIFEAVAGWKVLDEPLTSRPNEARRITFDVRGGVRYWFLGTEIDASFAPPPPLPGFDREFDGDARFADLILGGRVRVDLSDRLALVFAGDYGGFHISSKSTWDWNTQLVWELGEHWRMFGGYRMLDVERDHAEVQLKGPLLGATREF